MADGRVTEAEAESWTGRADATASGDPERVTVE